MKIVCKKMRKPILLVTSTILIGALTNNAYAQSNAAPTVTFNTPSAGEVFPAGGEILVDVSALDSDGSITSVDLFVDGTFLRTERSSLYQWGQPSGSSRAITDQALFTNLSDGEHELTAVATDDNGETSSTSLGIVVGETVEPPIVIEPPVIEPPEEPENSLPEVSFSSPTAGDTIDEGSSLAVTVNATDSDGSINNVTLSVDGELVRQENVTPYEWDENDSALQNLNPGPHELVAVATDDAGDSTEATMTFIVVESEEPTEEPPEDPPEDPTEPGPGTGDTPSVLIFTETRGFRHDSIPDAVDAIEELAESAGMETEHAGDSDGVFTDDNLANFDVVVWASTNGDVLNDTEQAAFERYIGAGGGYVGIHAASDTEFDWPWYGELVGAYFDGHPSIQQASQPVEDGTHISTAHLPAIWTRTDEWYDYQSNPRSSVNVLLTLDEDSYEGGQMGGDHPSAWFHEFSGGRSWYTGGGHTSESYSEDDFLTHILGGILYAAGISDGVSSN